MTARLLRIRPDEVAVKPLRWNLQSTPIRLMQPESMQLLRQIIHNAEDPTAEARIWSHGQNFLWVACSSPAAVRMWGCFSQLVKPVR